MTKHVIKIALLFLTFLLPEPRNVSARTDAPLQTIGSLSEISGLIGVGTIDNDEVLSPSLSLWKVSIHDPWKGNPPEGGILAICDSSLHDSCVPEEGDQLFFLAELTDQPLVQELGLSKEGHVYFLVPHKIDSAQDHATVKQIVASNGNLSNANVINLLKNTQNPYVRVSLLNEISEVNPREYSTVIPIIEEIMALPDDYLPEQIETTHLLTRLATGRDSLQFFENVWSHASLSQRAVIVNAIAETDDITLQAKRDFLLGKYSSSPEATKASIIRTLSGLADRAGILTLWNLEKQTLPAIGERVSEELSFALMVVGQCQPLKQWMASGGDDDEFIDANYYQCLGQTKNVRSLKILLTGLTSDNGWLIPSAKIAALKEIVSSGLLKGSQKTKLAKDLLGQVAQLHPQVQADLIDFMGGYFPQFLGQSARIALNPDAKKYVQSHAIMALAKRGNFGLIRDIARMTRYQDIKELSKTVLKKYDKSRETKKEAKPAVKLKPIVSPTTPLMTPPAPTKLPPKVKTSIK